MMTRDYNFIEARLLVPFGDKSMLDALERLRQIGMGKEADELMSVAQAVTDISREVRYRLTAKYRDEQKR